MFNWNFASEKYLYEIILEWVWVISGMCVRVFPG